MPTVDLLPEETVVRVMAGDQVVLSFELHGEDLTGQTVSGRLVQEDVEVTLVCAIPTVNTGGTGTAVITATATTEDMKTFSAPGHAVGDVVLTNAGAERTVAVLKVYLQPRITP